MLSHIHVARRRLLTTRQTARRLNICETALARMCENGVITPYDSELDIPARFTEAEVCALQARLVEEESGKEANAIQTVPA